MYHGLLTADHRHKYLRQRPDQIPSPIKVIVERTPFLIVPNESDRTLGAASSLDAPLYNSSNASVNFAVSEGDSFNLFAADSSSSSFFPAGASLTLTASFADGSTATVRVTIPEPPPPPPPPPSPEIALSFDGKLRDQVGRGDLALSGDGALDGTLTVTLKSGSGDRTVTGLNLQRGDNSNIRWNTTSDRYWILGAASSLDAPLYNSSHASVNFAVSEGGSFNLFAADPKSGGSYFPSGSTLILTAKFHDGSTADSQCDCTVDEFLVYDRVGRRCAHPP